jgi:hypothetical protein
MLFSRETNIVSIGLAWTVLRVSSRAFNQFVHARDKAGERERQW